MPTDDFKLYNVPAAMQRSVLKQDPADTTRWVRDEDWYAETRETYWELFAFMQDQNLLHRVVVTSPLDVDDVVMHWSDLTETGQAFVRTNAIDRWLRSFDRPGSKKKRSDVTMLSKALARLGSRSAAE